MSAHASWIYFPGLKRYVNMAMVMDVQAVDEDRGCYELFGATHVVINDIKDGEVLRAYLSREYSISTQPIQENIKGKR